MSFQKKKVLIQTKKKVFKLLKSKLLNPNLGRKTTVATILPIILFVFFLGLLTGIVLAGNLDRQAEGVKEFETDFETVLTGYEELLQIANRTQDIMAEFNKGLINFSLNAEMINELGVELGQLDAREKEIIQTISPLLQKHGWTSPQLRSDKVN